MMRVVHFELPSRHPDRLAEFYQKAFGWTVRKWSGQKEYGLLSTGEEQDPGIDGAVARSDEAGISCPVLTISVPSIDEYLHRVTEAGGKILRPRLAIPGVGYQVYCADPEGIVFGIMEGDPTVG